MERFVVSIDLTNDAFADGPATELAKILRKIAKQVEAGRFTDSCRDSNGNTVGSFQIHAPVRP